MMPRSSVKSAAAGILAVAVGGLAAWAGETVQTAPAQSPIAVTVQADKPGYRPGQPIVMTLTAANTSDRPVDLNFNTSQRYDFLIHDAAGVQRWKWSEERMFLQVLGQERLAPGESREFSETMMGSLEPGSYRLTGMLTAREPTPSATTVFIVE